MTWFSRSKKGCPALVGRSAVVTHIGDGCRAAGFLPIAMPPSLRHSVDLRSTPIYRLLPQAVNLLTLVAQRQLQVHGERLLTPL